MEGEFDVEAVAADRAGPRSCPAFEFNQINTFLFGGVTQHGEFVGNVCADLNGMGRGLSGMRPPA